MDEKVEDFARLQLKKFSDPEKSKIDLQPSFPVFENDPESPVSFPDLQLLPIKSRSHRGSNISLTNHNAVKNENFDNFSLSPLTGDSIANVSEHFSEKDTSSIMMNQSVQAASDVTQVKNRNLVKNASQACNSTGASNNFVLSNSKFAPKSNIMLESIKIKSVPKCEDNPDVFNKSKLTSWSCGSFGFGSLDITSPFLARKDRQIGTQNTSEAEVNPQKWAWVVMIASWLIMIPLVGIMSSFGTVVSSLTEDFNSTKLEVGWIGSLVFGVTVGLCPISNTLILVFGSRCIAGVGIIGSAACAFITSEIRYLAFMILSYSVGLGIFANLVYNSSLSLTGIYFPNKHQALATCIASAGISFGTIVFNPISRILLTKVGWRITFRIYAGLILGIGLPCVATFRPPSIKVISTMQLNSEFERDKQTNIRSKSEGFGIPSRTATVERERASVSETLTPPSYPSGSSRMSIVMKELKHSLFSKDSFDCAICSNPVFILWMIGTLFWSFTLLLPHIFLIDYMEMLQISPESGAVVLTTFGVFDLLGRIGCAFGAGKLRFSYAYVYSFCTLINGVVTMLTPFGESLKYIYIYAIIVGTNTGVINSLMFAANSQFFSKHERRNAWGYVNVMLASGMVGGPVFAGGIYDLTESYRIAFYVNGLLYVICSAVMAGIPVVLARAQSILKEQSFASLPDNKEMVMEMAYLSSSKAKKSPNIKSGILKEGIVLPKIEKTASSSKTSRIV